MADHFNLGENAQSFKTAPKFAAFDMVVLNIDDNNYVSSPYAVLDNDVWESVSARQNNGKYIFEYVDGSWKQTAGPGSFDASATVNLQSIGITAAFTVAGAAEKAGDTITVSRFEDRENNTLQLSIELTRSGRTMETNCPLVKAADRQAIADGLLAKLCGRQYQPFSATAAEVNPLMELGDAISAHGIYTGLFQQDLEFNSLMSSDISAPGEEETDSEYKYETANERRYARKFADISAEFLIHADAIEARVTKEGGTNSSFAWKLLADSWSVYSSNSEVFRIDSSGATVKGTITAESGYIGTYPIGFAISASAIMNGMESFADTDHNGVYVGTDGIALGGGKFKVDSQGNLTAENGTFHGTVQAKNIVYGGDNGTFNGGGLTGGSVGGSKIGSNSIGAGHVVSSSLGTGQFQSSVTDSLGYANHAHSAFEGLEEVNWLKANSINTGHLRVPGGSPKLTVDSNGLYILGSKVKWLTIFYDNGGVSQGQTVLVPA